MTCLEARYASTGARHAFRLWLKAGEQFAFPATRECPPMVFAQDEFPHHLVTPRLGRFYPTRPLQLPLPAPMFRVIEMTGEELTLDCTPPWKIFRPEVREIQSVDPAPALGRSADLIAWLGMESPLAHTPTDFAEAQALHREDESADSGFYTTVRLVEHLDAVCRRRIAALYQELLAPGAKVLDLMASWDSHVPAGRYDLSVLGMNDAELAANLAASERMVHDLNRTPTLPWPDASFDAVINTASIEYLTQPGIVLAEVRRILKPGGLVVVSFSNRYFPSKAIRLWKFLHPMERLGWVLAQLANAGFCECQTLVECGLQRPLDDRHADRYPTMDPLFAAWARTST